MGVRREELPRLSRRQGGYAEAPELSALAGRGVQQLRELPEDRGSAEGPRGGPAGRRARLHGAGPPSPGAGLRQAGAQRRRSVAITKTKLFRFGIQQSSPASPLRSS